MKQNVPFAPQRYFDLSGLPWTAGTCGSTKGTSTPATAAIWFDADGLVAGSNPVQLDGAGQPQPTGAFYLDPGAYAGPVRRRRCPDRPPVDVVIFGATFGGSDGQPGRRDHLQDLRRRPQPVAGLGRGLCLR